jgi:thiol-disulfide isomerase/thioredoxin
MREVVINLVLFVILALVFSSLNGCSGTTTNGNSSTGVTIPDPPRVGDSDPSKNALFPPLPTGFASSEIEMLDGTKTKISDHKGKTLVLNLWAIWCGWCRDEMPHLAQMQKQYGDRLEVISLSVGDQTTGSPEPVDAIKKFAADMKIDYTLGRIGGDSLRQFYMLTKQTAIPQTVMVDRDGRLRNIFVGGGPKNMAEMQQSIDKIMNSGG